MPMSATRTGSWLWIGLGIAALVSIPAAMLLSGSLASRARARDMRCLTNLQAIGKAIWEYQQGHGRPPGQLEELVTAGLLQPEQLHCPADRDGTGSSYVLVPGMAAGMHPGRILAYEAKVRHGFRRCAVFADTSVRRLTQEDFERGMGAPDTQPATQPGAAAATQPVGG